MTGVEVSLAGGKSFYVDATVDDLRALVGPAAYRRELVQIGVRWVNAAQVTQLVPVEVPAHLGVIPERLEVSDGVAVS